VALAVAAYLIPLPPAIVERTYSLRVFPSIQSVVTPLSNLTRLALFDLFLIVALAAIAGRCVRDLVARRWWTALPRIAVRLVVVGSVVYLVFLAMWGLNYRRASMKARVPFDASRITPEAVALLARDTVDRVNADYAAAHAEGWPAAGAIDDALVESFSRASGALGLPPGVVPGRPKRTLLDLYFRRAGVAGMTDPFFLETLVASDVLPFERPMVVTHEWAHLAGITDEGEANFTGWLACVRGTTAARYSGWLFLYSEVMDALPRDAAREVSAALGTGPRADLAAIRERYQREVSPRISGAGWQVYDQYLKANRVEAGTRSYGEVVQLVLGTARR